MAARLNKLLVVFKDGEVEEFFFRSIDEAKSHASVNRYAVGRDAKCSCVLIFPMYLDSHGQYKGNAHKAYYRYTVTGAWVYVTPKE